MKKITVIAALLTLLYACTGNKPGVVGTVSDHSLDGKEIYLLQHSNFDLSYEDTAVIQNGKFEFPDLDEGVYYILMDDSTAGFEIKQGLPVYVGEGKATVAISGDSVTISGNPENEAWQKVVAANRSIRDQLFSLEAWGDNATDDSKIEELWTQVQPLMEKQRGLISAYVHENIQNPLGEEIFLNYIELFSMDDIEAIVSEADEAFRSNPMIVEVLAEIAARKYSGMGASFLDFNLPDAQGKIIALSDYAGKGKYVLLDFWASWCTPCLKEMPAIRELYDQYKNKNLVIIGISLDENKTEWLNAVQKFKMSWIQLSDHEGNNIASSLYRVTTIPHTVLIDPQGTIIAKDLRGEELNKQLAELLK
ncbi:MAG: AhpC/TSA family protein [Dysgonamonadaceae bacterium]|jgi:peroxiredoxin|nr:AhpC/TSA family protein [Dysgonamonadaceae bacterium]